MDRSSTSFLLLFALCLVPASLVSARLVGGPFHVCGRVYCDTCNCGFETNRTTYIAGANVVLECRDRITFELRYRADATTDLTGTYTFVVEDDHGDDRCYVKQLFSPQHDCKTPDPRRSSAEVVLTANNGNAVSAVHHGNAVGFKKDQELPGCKEFIRQLLASDD